MNFFGSYHFSSNYFATNYLAGSRSVLPPPQVFRQGGSGRANEANNDLRLEQERKERILRDDEDVLMICATSFLTIISNGD